MSQPEIKIGLIGLGNMGKNHLRILSNLKGAKLNFISDRNLERAKNFSKEYDLPVANDYLEVAKSVDAIVLVSPTSSHYKIIKKIAPLVSGIFVEKPLAPSLEECKILDKLCKLHNTYVQVGYVERFNPAVQVLNKILKTQKVIASDFTRANKLSDRIKDVDVITDLMVHDIDLALHLFGEVESIQAYGQIGNQENQMIHWARATLKHTSGSYSSLTASRITEKRIRQISLTCEGAYVDANLLHREVYLSKQYEEHYRDTVSVTGSEEAFDVRPIEPLFSELNTFVQNLIEFTSNKSLSLDYPDTQSSIQVAQIADKVRNLILSAQN
jgi:predicted dehydrogenase